MTKRLTIQQWERRAVLEQSRSFIFFNLSEARKHDRKDDIAEFNQKLAEVDKEIETLTATIK
jgi:phosphopentomutase